jgi:hypothetical protein
MDNLKTSCSDYEEDDSVAACLTFQWICLFCATNVVSLSSSGLCFELIGIGFVFAYAQVSILLAWIFSNCGADRNICELSGMS